MRQARLAASAGMSWTVGPDNSVLAAASLYRVPLPSPVDL